MSQNIAFDRRQQTGKLLIQNARGSCSISWHVALLCASLTLVQLQPPLAPVPAPPALCFLTRVLNDSISSNYPRPRVTADTGQYFGCWKLYFYHTLMAESQEGEAFYSTQGWVQGWTYQKYVMNSAHKQHTANLPYKFNKTLPMLKYYTFVVGLNTEQK